MSEIRNLEPKVIWENFQNICNIPHPSKHESAIIEFVKKFGQDLGLKTIVDEVGNVIIKKPATKGMENRKGIVLQGHLDMVPQKNSDTNHDFVKDPINAYIDGEWITARGTTLGADNGIGCAAAMAVLQSKDIAHGPIEALFTIDEETGMTGAFGLKPNLLDGEILMNLDSEDEGELYIGCAGGVDTNAEFTFTKDSVPADSVAYKISITGLKGGHSGLDIILQRGNSNKIMTRFMWNAYRNLNLRMASFEGGSLRNAIPREAFAVVTISKSNEKELLKYADEYYQIIKKELASTEPEFKFELVKAQMPTDLIDATTTQNLLSALYACPNGVMRMSDDMKGLVETSLNLAIVKSKENTIEVNCLLRSSVDSAKEDLSHMVENVFALAGANVKHEGAYPGWKPNVESPILKTMKEGYNKKYGKIPEVKAIHAGLECGLLGNVYPKMDMISFGPTIRYPHSPDEKVHIASVQKFWDFLVETLKYAPTK
ncbi:MAG: cytosol nonspecific dipeptidase [Bacteroidetes bacterium GWF2_33_38]|nr:MAG: cytosol nonspecific dipeptidase [Bacteroidetes bacterium GWF2_33_38]OFY73813.1 MAG: cytosol nonspecific dipeptidase [Bacteroidetes bacterium RIFOXYA12_FULL_33_9]OFY89410.1 MAG: cytosol nonspecific dipeptidase [Bacteroidetes bacterium RIFOXYA2_FULL_33_7]HBX51648.1 cytosol nonspecific dipeptidase [Bacteroidales bacterium]